jgi:hypothetical protein
MPHVPNEQISRARTTSDRKINGAKRHLYRSWTAGPQFLHRTRRPARPTARENSKAQAETKTDSAMSRVGSWTAMRHPRAWRKNDHRSRCVAASPVVSSDPCTASSTFYFCRSTLSSFCQSVLLSHTRWARVLRRSGDVARESTAAGATQRHVALRRWRHAIGITLDRTGARWATEWRARAVAGDEMQRLGRVICIRTWLAHVSSKCAPGAQ